MKNNRGIFRILVIAIVLVFAVVGCSSVMDEPIPKEVVTEMMDDEVKSEDEMMVDEALPKVPMTEPEEMMTNEGKGAPEFEFTDSEGNVHTLADYKGQKVYIKYWASWCSICLAGLSEVNELAADTQDFVVLTVVTPGANREKSKEDFIEWFDGLEYKNITVLFDEKGEVGKELGIRAFPTSVFIGSDGVLIQVSPGHKDNSVINDTVASFY